MKTRSLIWLALVVITGLVPMELRAVDTKASPSPSASASPSPAPTPPAEKDLVDINSADEKSLEKLPGVGTAYAKKIVAGRPYKKKDQLVAKKVLTKKIYDKVKDWIIAKQPAKDGAKKAK